MNIQTQAIITSVRSRVDGSIGFSGVTPEYTTEDKVRFMEIQGQNAVLTIEPTDNTSTDTHIPEGELEGKTRSQKLRNALYVLWNEKYKGKYTEFDGFYNRQMRVITEQVLAKVDSS